VRLLNPTGKRLRHCREDPHNGNPGKEPAVVFSQTRRFLAQKTLVLNRLSTLARRWTVMHGRLISSQVIAVSLSREVRRLANRDMVPQIDNK
jgi:hypothetical protein